MKSISLRQRLLNYIRKHYPLKIYKADLQRMTAAKTRYTPENAGRRLRELQEDGFILVDYDEKGNARYQAPPPKDCTVYCVPDLGKEIVVTKY